MTEAVNNTLRDLFAEPLKLVVAGEELAITPLRFGMIPRVLDLASPFLGQLVQLRPGVAVEVDMIELVSRHGDRVNALVALLAGKPRDWVDNLPPDEALKLVGALVEVNWDFFSHRLQPAFKSAWSRLSGKWSNLLSPAPTPAPTTGPTLPSG